MNPLSFLQSVAGFVQEQQTSSADRPARLATIDPTYSSVSFPTTLPKVTFDGEAALSTRQYAVLSPYWPVPGDRVLMTPVGNTYVVAGSVSATSLPVWQAYTPAWTSNGTQPAINNGSIVGRYSKQGTVVRAAVRLLMGSTTTYGTGGYSISLPVSAATTSSPFRVGSAYCRDASATSSGHFPAICVIDTGSPLVVSFFNGVAQVTNVAPFTWANTDHLSFTIVYESAS